MEFSSTNPAVVKSIRQRELLNHWLRLYAKRGQLPLIEDYRPDCLAQEADDLVRYTVDHGTEAVRFVIDSNGTRMSNAYGATGKGRYLDEYVGPQLAALVIPVYQECVRQRLPVFTVSKVNDIDGRRVDYERLLLPFASADRVDHILASLKTISEDGGFEIKNLMRANDIPPIPVLRTVIDRDLFHRAPGRVSGSGDAVEFV